MQPETSCLETPHQFNVRKICNLSARLPASEMINFAPRKMRLVINYILPLRIHPAVNWRLHEDRLLQLGDMPPDRLINWLLMIWRTHDDSRNLPSRENPAGKHIGNFVFDFQILFNY